MIEFLIYQLILEITEILIDIWNNLILAEL